MTSITETNKKNITYLFYHLLALALHYTLTVEYKVMNTVTLSHMASSSRVFTSFTLHTVRVRYKSFLPNSTTLLNYMWILTTYKNPEYQLLSFASVFSTKKLGYYKSLNIKSPHKACRHVGRAQKYWVYVDDGKHGKHGK